MSNRFEQEVLASDAYELVTDLFCHFTLNALYIVMYSIIELQPSLCSSFFSQLTHGYSCAIGYQMHTNWAKYHHLLVYFYTVSKKRKSKNCAFLVGG